MKSSRNTNSKYSSIESLNALLTPPQVFKFIKKAVPELKADQAALQQSLESQQWKAAAKQAHRLKTTISLFSADSLVNSLDIIELGTDSVIQSPEFRESLITQCQQLIDSLEHYLNNS